MISRRGPATIRRRSIRTLATAMAVGALTLLTAITAIAAQPKPGKFSGLTSQPKFNGFRATVSFTAASRKLVKFTYQSAGCSGQAGLTPGVNFLGKPQNVYPVGTIKVASNGKFSVKNATFRFHQSGSTVITKTTVTGSFTKSKLASGTISYKQQTVIPNVGASKCDPPAFKFTAKTK
jgi:hypothetical protein